MRDNVYSRRVHVTMTAATVDLLDELSKVTGATRSTLIRRAVHATYGKTDELGDVIDDYLNTRTNR